MSNYDTAWNSLIKAIGSVNKDNTATVDEIDHLTPDQQLKVAEVVALLSIAQELSAIRHKGTNPDFSPQ